MRVTQLVDYFNGLLELLHHRDISDISLTTIAIADRSTAFGVREDLAW